MNHLIEIFQKQHNLCHNDMSGGDYNFQYIEWLEGVINEREIKTESKVEFGVRTKLEYFSGLAMQGIMANTHLTQSGYVEMAQVAVKQAKVLLDELAKENF